MTEPTEPTREQIVEAIDGLVNDTDAPQWMCENVANGTHTDWTIAVLRMALRTLDAEAQLDRARRRIAAFDARDARADETIAALSNELAAMTERAEKAERECTEAWDVHGMAVARAEKAERERDEAIAKLAQVQKEAENLLWNLAGCDTIASSGTPTTFDDSMARPALHAVNQMATRLVDVERERDEAIEDRRQARAELVQRGMEIDALKAEKKIAVDAFHDATRLRSEIQAARTKAEDERDAARDDIAQLRAIIARMSAELDEAIEDRNAARDDAARAAALLAVRTMERDYALASARIGNNTICKVADILECATGERVQDAARRVVRELRDATERAHAAGSGASEVELRSPTGLAFTADDGGESPRTPIDLASKASGGVCGTCRGVDVGMAHWTCPDCKGTGSTTGTKS